MRLFTTLHNYKKNYLAKDLIAGVVMAAVSIPIAMGYAEVSGIPVVYGLYGSVLPILFICLLFDIATVYLWRGCRTGSNCWRQCELPWNCIWICGSDRLYFHDRLMHRIVVVTVYVLKTGKMVDFISTPVMGGFVSGIAVTIILMQIPKVLGASSGTGSFRNYCTIYGKLCIT